MRPVLWKINFLPVSVVVQNEPAQWAYIVRPNLCDGTPGTDIVSVYGANSKCAGVLITQKKGGDVVSLGGSCVVELNYIQQAKRKNIKHFWTENGEAAAVSVCTLLSPLQYRTPYKCCSTAAPLSISFWKNVQVALFYINYSTWKSY